MSQIEQLIKERDEAREWVRRLQKETQTLTCVYCGQEYPPGSPTHGAKVLTNHIKICEKHPMNKMRKALIALVGTEDVEELKGMAKVIQDINSPYIGDKIAMILCIKALLETITPQEVDEAIAKLEKGEK